MRSRGDGTCIPPRHTLQTVRGTSVRHTGLTHLGPGRPGAHGRARWLPASRGCQHLQAGEVVGTPRAGLPSWVFHSDAGDRQRETLGGRGHRGGAGQGGCQEAPLGISEPKGATGREGGAIQAQGPALRRERRGVCEERPGALLQGKAGTQREEVTVCGTVSLCELCVCPAAKNGNDALPTPLQGRNGRNQDPTQPSSMSSPSPVSTPHAGPEPAMLAGHPQPHGLYQTLPFPH